MFLRRRIGKSKKSEAESEWNRKKIHREGIEID